MIDGAGISGISTVSCGARRPRRLRLVLQRRLVASDLAGSEPFGRRVHPGVVVLVALALVVLGAALGAALHSRVVAAQNRGISSFSPEIAAVAAQARSGGLVTVEVDARGRVVLYSAEIDPTQLPPACLEVARTAAPGGRLVGAEKQVMDGVTYYEIEEDVDGQRVELLVTPDGRLAGREDEVSAMTAPASVLAAAHDAVPDGTLEAVELVSGPESLGGLEYHVKKRVGGEVLRIRVTDQGAVEVLRKLRTELRIPR